MAAKTKKERELPIASDVVEPTEMHCGACGRFLCYQQIVWGVIKIKCSNSKCKEWNTIDISPGHKVE